MVSTLRGFWLRISDGVAIHHLWEQFRADAQTSYHLYSKEFESKEIEGESRRKRGWHVARGLFWAVVMKLSPARRVLLLIALLILFLPSIRITGEHFAVDSNGSQWAGAILLVLLALELADRVAMKRDLEIAREIQRWPMPSVAPKVPGMEIAFAARPANTVAGDYYDAFLRPNEHLLIVVADVAGKSVPAALLTATLQASLRTLASLPGSLTELACRVNRYACEQNVGGHRLTTAFFGELDPATGCLTYVNAGHNWPVLRHASGAIERLEAGGLPLGLTAARSYQSATTALAAGDLLFIFTDGIVEAENSRALEYGEERMLPLMQGLHDVTANEALNRLMSSVDSFVGVARQHDDMTCLVVRKY
jgi:serine phosphatase RsbU (regulator of sigma subunit)